MSKNMKSESLNESSGNTIYDYEFQCWVVGGIIQSCAHPASMDCKCFARKHAGERLLTGTCGNEPINND